LENKDGDFVEILETGVTNHQELYQTIEKLKIILARK
jgi:hypothetical protein